MMVEKCQLIKMNHMMLHTIYTPRGIPINEFQLNFNNKENQDSIVRRNDEIINSFDDEVRDLINGADNF